jgi:hypothetical protein
VFHLLPQGIISPSVFEGSEEKRGRHYLSFLRFIFLRRELTEKQRERRTTKNFGRKKEEEKGNILPSNFVSSLPKGIISFCFLKILPMRINL